MNRLRLLGVAMFAMGVLGGCSGAPAPPPASPPAPAPSSALPQQIDIAAIGARSSLVPTGINTDGSPEVPPLNTPEQASWYCPPATGATAACDWPMPGETGPATIYGHINGSGRPGVFADLADLAAGDEVLITRTDGVALRFVITGIETVPKAELDAPGSAAIDRVYGPTGGPELRLVTCGGALDEDSGHYVDQVVAYARLA